MTCAAVVAVAIAVTLLPPIVLCLLLTSAPLPQCISCKQPEALSGHFLPRENLALTYKRLARRPCCCHTPRRSSPCHRR
uniref:Secreted protein n=1 Tax=Knipowitschia caucasica TaxID=637954 RepID=A0AAV2M956_KNICA